MIDQAAYQQTLSRIKAGKPALAAFFVVAVERAASLMPLDAAALRALGELSLVSELAYVDVDTLLPRAAARGDLGVVSRLLFELSRLHRSYAPVLLSRYNALPFPLHEVRDDLLDCARRCAPHVKNAAAVLGFCLAPTDGAFARFLLRQASTIAAFSPRWLPELIASFSAMMKTRPATEFARWLARGTDLLTSNRVDEGVRFLRGRSAESRRALGLTAVVLEDIRNVLRIYSASLAGRELGIVSLESSSFGATIPYSDGKTIFLPPEMGMFEDPQDNERAYSVLAAEQAAAVSMGTFGFDLSAIDFAEELGERYGTALPPVMENVRKQYGHVARTIRARASGDIEVVFPSGRTIVVLETEHERFFYRFPAPDLARELFILVENARIERALSARYPGLREDCLLYNTKVWTARPRLAVAAQDLLSGFRVALECLVQFSLLGRHRCVLDDGAIARQAQRIMQEYERSVREASSVQDSARGCFLLYNLFAEMFPIIPWCSRNDIREVLAGVGKQDMRPEIVRDASPEMLKAQVEPRLPEEPSEEKVREIDITDRSRTEKNADIVRRAVAAGDLRLYRYPEFDCFAGSYHPRHCTLYERTLETVESDFYNETLKALRLTHEKTKKRFLSLRPEGVELSRRWPSGDEIDLSDAVDYCIDLLRGASPEETIYFRKVRNTRDAVAAILVDASSSTDETVNGRKVIDTEKAALAILSSALSMIGDDFGVFSYFSLGRHRVFFDVVKDFTEPWDSRRQGRIAAIRPQASNRDGCAIRHAAARLADQPQRTKLLLLLSDGIPADVGYGGANSAETSEYAIGDTRRAVLECRMKGIVPYCITIDRAARQYVAHLYGSYHYTVLDDVTALPERLSRHYLRLMG